MVLDVANESLSMSVALGKSERSEEAPDNNGAWVRVGLRERPLRVSALAGYVPDNVRTMEGGQREEESARLPSGQCVTD